MCEVFGSPSSIRESSLSISSVTFLHPITSRASCTITVAVLGLASIACKMRFKVATAMGAYRLLSHFTNSTGTVRMTPDQLRFAASLIFGLLTVRATSKVLSLRSIIERLRHDLANQVDVVSELARVGHLKEADQYLAMLQNQAQTLIGDGYE